MLEGYCSLIRADGCIICDKGADEAHLASSGHSAYVDGDRQLATLENYDLERYILTN